MSAQLEDVTEQEQLKLFEGKPVQRATFTMTVTVEDARIDGELLDASLGDRVALSEVEGLVTDVNHGEKHKWTMEDDGRALRSNGVGPVTRKHVAQQVPGTAVITSVTRRESDEDRVRRLTR